ncbi:MAG: hypothetical protein V7K27_23020 [Nostoc sp.]|uniref:hypothetical protein n=1 Tax=Nostoc sp. TaxID=1180 RepID=UPI002FF768B0
MTIGPLVVLLLWIIVGASQKGGLRSSKKSENAWQEIFQRSRDGCRSTELMGCQAY